MYYLLFVFAKQKWLRHCACILRHTYTAYLFNSSYPNLCYSRVLLFIVFVVYVTAVTLMLRFVTTKEKIFCARIQWPSQSSNILSLRKAECLTVSAAAHHREG
jgi:hypothetical protein